jgi:ribosomal protein S12 methylthiotransferase accessory factor
MLELHSRTKGYTLDLDKAVPPEETVTRIRGVLSGFGDQILERAVRIDTGRLGIPVYMATFGPLARQVMPSRKQMGKGASPAQAEASALMEIVERFSLFSYFSSRDLPALSWEQAEKTFGDELVPISDILQSVHEDLPEDQARKLLNLLQWRFAPALSLTGRSQVRLPLEWVRTLNEYNGSSAGNVLEESVLQGVLELVERHVCCVIDREKPVLPTLDPESFQDPVLVRLWRSFADQNILLWLKDFSLNTRIPTVGALAYDPATFPDSSEIVFTAGTATSPEKAAIRALTEIAQLGGDFETRSLYEASGLSKFTSLDGCEWVMQGERMPIGSLPDISHQDLLQELETAGERISRLGHSLYSIDISHPELKVPANMSFIPGFTFRERTPHASLGLFIGRLLTENAAFHQAAEGLEVIRSIYPNGHFIPFFQGLLELNSGDVESALSHFHQAEPLQPCAHDQALTAFYQGYAHTQAQNWDQALPHLNRALSLSPDSHAFMNLRGVAHFKLGDVERAAEDFHSALGLDSGSAVDLANLGLCYKAMNRPDMAIHYLQAGLELDADLDFARDHLQELLQEAR